MGEHQDFLEEERQNLPPIEQLRKVYRPGQQDLRSLARIRQRLLAGEQAPTSIMLQKTSNSYSNQKDTKRMNTMDYHIQVTKTPKAFNRRRALVFFAAVLSLVLIMSTVIVSQRLLGHQGPDTGATSVVGSTPSSVTPTIAPSGRVHGQLVYDQAMNALLLFSGQDYTGAAPLIDTWTWNGSIWTRLHPAHSPSARTDAAIAYDPVTQQVVLFGGMSTTGETAILGDTWTWNGSDWTQQHPATSPDTRTLASLAYDAATDQLVLFGGKHATGFAPGLNDTWTWTGSNWVQQFPATAPSAREQATLAYDEANHNLVLFGGGSPGQTLNDTWTWTGSNWVQQFPKTSPVLTATLQGQAVTFSDPSMVYNLNTGKLMLTLIGQGANDGTQNDYWTQVVWNWNGSDWTQVNAIGPAVQSGVIFYDTHQHAIFELTAYQSRSSVTVENNLWRWNGHAWVLIEKW